MKALDLVSVAACVALVGCGATASAPGPRPGGEGAEPPGARSHAPPGLRLPGLVQPTAYRVFVRLDPAEPAFRGKIEIDLRVHSRSRVIWLHAHGLEVENATAAIGGEVVTLSPRRRDDEVIGLHAPRLLEGVVTVALSYRGQQDERSTAGLFRQREGGDWYSFTQLEPIFARRVFPSIDEPGRKTPWTVSLEVPAGLTALANTRQLGETPAGDGWKHVTFARTRPLPPHLVAFAVGPFAIADAGVSRTGAPIRIVGPRGKLQRTALAAWAVPRALASLEDYLGSPYPYDKLDLVSIPITVGFLCMENPGLVTCREEEMLFDPAAWSAENRRSITRLAAHELAHQWFGNLVTPAWWDDLWLNEGLATWIEDRVASAVDPRPDDVFAAADNQAEALGLDRSPSVPAVRRRVESQGDILNAFNRVTYSKAGAVIAMLERSAGAGRFQRGLRRYVRDHADGVVTAGDLDAAIRQEGGGDVDWLAAYLDEPGAPLLRTDLRCGPPGTRPELHVRQSGDVRRSAERRGGKADGVPHWEVPFCWAHDRDGKRGEMCAVLKKDRATIVLDTRSCPRWLLPRVAGVGHYKLQMTRTMVDRVLAAGWSELTPVERVMLARDVWSATRAEALDIGVALGLIPRLLREDNRAALEAALELASWRRLLPRTHLESYYRWFAKTFGPEARRLGWLARPGEPSDHDRRRRAVLPRVVEAGDPVLGHQTLMLTASWRNLPPGLRTDVLRLGIRADTRGVLFERLLNQVVLEQDPAIRADMFGALVATRGSARIARLLGLLLDPRIDIREVAWWPGWFRHGPDHTQAETFVRQHLDELLARYPRDAPFGQLPPFTEVFTNVCTEARRMEIQTLLRAAFSKLPGGARPVEDELEAMDGCIWRRASLGPLLARWLDGQAGR